MSIFERVGRKRRDAADASAVLENLERMTSFYGTRSIEPAARPELDSLTRAAAEQLSTPIAVLTLVEDRRQVFVSRYDREVGEPSPHETPLDIACSNEIVERGAPLVVSDATVDDAVPDHDQATADAGVRLYLGVPLRSTTGACLGSFCVVDLRPRRWSDDDRRQLEALAGSAMEVAVTG